jgi:hypothetical protein
MIGLLAFAQNDVINDKNAEKRNVTGFHAVHIASGIDLYFSQGAESVVVSAEDMSDRNKIKTEVTDGVLKIYLDEHWGHHGDRKLKAYVSCKVLDQLEASGGSDVFIKGAVQGEKLSINLSGGSDLKGKITVGSLSIEQSGGSDSDISGTAPRLSVHVSGGSDFHGYDLVADECNVEASGGSDIHLTANKALNVETSGGSDVYYKGSAVVRELHTSGGGSVSHKG